MQLQPYLFFNGRCEEAVEFYRKSLGAEGIELFHYRDAPEQPPPGATPAGFEDKIMHGTFRLGGVTVMVSDGHSSAPAAFQGFSLALTVKSEAEADRVFGALAEGGQVTVPLGKTFFSVRFGMVTDRFGVLWMVSTE